MSAAFDRILKSRTCLRDREERGVPIGHRPTSVVAVFAAAIVLGVGAAEGARPTITAVAQAEASGTSIAYADAAAQQGETMALSVTVSHAEGSNQSITVEVSTLDPYGRIPAGFSSTTMTVPSGVPTATATGALRVQVRLDAPCGHVIPVVVKARRTAVPADETNTVHGVLVGRPDGTVFASRGPVRLPANTADDGPGAWKTTAPEKFCRLDWNASGFYFMVFSAEGQFEDAAYAGSSTGSIPAIARGSDGWGAVYTRSGDLYFRKYGDDQTLTAEILVANSAQAIYSPHLAWDPVIGYVVVFARYIALGNYGVYARRIHDNGTLDTIDGEYDLTLSLELPMDGFALANSYSGGAAPNRLSYFSFFYKSGATLSAKRFWWYEAASLNTPSGYAAAVVVDDPTVGGVGTGVTSARVATSSVSDGANQYVAYTVLDSVTGGPALYYRRVDLVGGVIDVGTRLLITFPSSGSSAIRYDLARRGADDEISIVLAMRDGTNVVRGILEVEVDPDPTPAVPYTPVLGPWRSVSGPLAFDKVGQPHLLWRSGQRVVHFLHGGLVDDDSVGFLSWEAADTRTLVVPTLGNEPELTIAGQSQRVAVAAAGERIGVFTHSYDEGGFFFRVADREGSILAGPLPVGGQDSIPIALDEPRLAIATDGEDFVLLYRPTSSATFRFAKVDGETGAIVAGPTTIPLDTVSGTSTSVVDSVVPRLAWTGDRYRYLFAETDGSTDFYTGTITKAGALEGGNHLELGTSTATRGDLGCNGAGRCWAVFGTALRTQVSAGNMTSFAARTLASDGLLVASDGCGALVLRSDGVPERLWPDGSQRSAGAVLAGWTTGSRFRRLLFDGAGYLLSEFRPGNSDEGQPWLRRLGLDGAAAPGFDPDGSLPLASFDAIRGDVDSSDVAFLPGGAGVLLFCRDLARQGDFDLTLTRFELPEGLLSTCGVRANAVPVISAGGPYTLRIRNGTPGPYVLTDGSSGTNQATFQATASCAEYATGFRLAGWDFNHDGTIDVEVSDANGDGVISAAESQVVLSSAQLLDYGFPTNRTACPECVVRFDAQIEPTGADAWAEVPVALVDEVPPSVVLTVPNGGETWPGGSTQTISWAASDNQPQLSAFDLSVTFLDPVEFVYTPTVSLPLALTEGAYTYLYFNIPSLFTVQDVSVDIDITWPGVEPSANIQLVNLTTGINRLVQLGTNPASNFTAISGNYDRTLSTYQSLAVFDGASSGSQWRIAISNPANGNVGTLNALRLRLVAAPGATLPIATNLPGANRSYSWAVPATISPRTRVTVTARDLAALPNSATDSSDGTFFVTQSNADQVRTMIVWNEGRMRARYPAADVDALEAKLLALASHVKIDGVLVDLSSGEAAAAGISYLPWDGTTATPAGTFAWNDGVLTDNAANAAAANVVAGAIRTYLYDKVESLFPNLETMILVGGDGLVPFFREGDTTPIHPETDYVAELASFGFAIDCNATRSPTLAAMCTGDNLGYYLSDGRYGASSAKPVPGSALAWWLPDVAVGRLVETPLQIAALIDTFVAQDGVTIVDRVMTTGYDFLTDGGDACHAAFVAALDPAAAAFVRLSEAVSTWNDNQLKNNLFGVGGSQAADLSIVSGHADHRAEGAAAAGSAGILDTLEMNSGTGVVPGATLVGLGCHTGLSILPDGGPSDPVAAGFTLDLAELFATKRFPAFVGNTGFGWGLTDGVGLGEKLLLLVTDEITRGGQVPLGEALRLAKQEYFLRQDRLDAFDHKVLHESTFYGIPNYEVRVTKKLPLAGEPATESWAGVGTGQARAELAAMKADGPRIPGEPWLGDPSWERTEKGGRELSKTKVRAFRKGANGEAIEVPEGESTTDVSLRIMDFSYRAYDVTPPAWQASTVYTAPATVRPTTANGHVYSATNSGTSGATEPAWPTTPGGTVVNGTITWQEVSGAWPNAYRRNDVCTDTTTQESEPCTGPGGAAGAGQTKVGTYLTLDGLATDESGDALQPMISFDSHLAGTELHGIVMKGGEYVQPPELNPVDAVNCTNEFGVALRCFDPVVGNPQTKAALPEGPAPAPFIQHSQPTPFIQHSQPTPNGFEETNGNPNAGSNRWDNLNAPMGDLIRRGAKGAGASRKEISVEWLYRTRDFTQYYSNSSDSTPPVIGAITGDCGGARWTASTAYAIGSTASAVAPNGHFYVATLGGTSGSSEPAWPTTAGASVVDGSVTWTENGDSRCFSTLSGLTVTFNVPVSDAGDGVYRVFVTHTSDVDSSWSGAWQTLELSLSGGSFVGSIDVPRTTHYLVQAVDWAGNVARVLATGSDVSSGGAPLGSEFSLERVFSVIVPDADADGLPDAYEVLHPCLDKLVADATGDPDLDYLPTLVEFEAGLHPCNADSDGGGDNDGSERANGRDPLDLSDDVDITITISQAGADKTISWPDGIGQNGQVDGYYHVYRSDTPFFDPGDKISPAPIPNGTTSYLDVNPACTTCFYKVWNVVVATQPPLVAAIVPSVGPAAGGTSVQIYGQNFVAGATVDFCGAAAIGVNVVSPNLVTATSPARALGSCTVKVTNPNGQEGQLTNGYLYQ